MKALYSLESSWRESLNRMEDNTRCVKACKSFFSRTNCWSGNRCAFIDASTPKGKKSLTCLMRFRKLRLNIEIVDWKAELLAKRKNTFGRSELWENQSFDESKL